MSKILVFGHKSPDTDAITSAISYANLLNELGLEAEPVQLGPTNPETKYALDHFKHSELPIIETAADKTDTVALVDHNERQQSVSDLDQVTVHSVVDHHRIANFETSAPLYYTARPWGCTQTAIYTLYRQAGVEIPAQIAGLMLSGIISDTLLFSSPTTTDFDREYSKELAKIAGMSEEEVNEYGTEMLKAGANVDVKTAKQIADGDGKSYSMGNYTLRIGQVNVVDVNDVLKRKDEVLDAMQNLCDENGYDAFILIITNILTNDSEGLLISKEELVPKFEEAFGVKVVDHELPLKGVVSRKKQVVPPLTEAFK